MLQPLALKAQGWREGKILKLQSGKCCSSNGVLEPGIYLSPRGSFPSYYVKERYDESHNLTDNSNENVKESQRLIMGEQFRHYYQS